MTDVSNIRLSAIDEERFGIQTARVESVTHDQLPAVDEFCRFNTVKFLIARCDAAELSTAQAMETQDFLLMDTLVYFARKIASAPIPSTAEGISVRPVREDEAKSIGGLAARAFQDYGGHYHADSRLDRADCDAVYQSWAQRSCESRAVADGVLVAELDGKIVGFTTLKIRNPDEGEVPLYGVDPSIQGQGIGRALISGALRWFEAQNVAKMLISTQVTNVASQKVWVRLGFEPSHAYYTFHKWFD
ncbi:MAG: GNAT family N-acetyltransferase [Chloroflexota bacterium]